MQEDPSTVQQNAPKTDTSAPARIATEVQLKFVQARGYAIDTIEKLQAFVNQMPNEEWVSFAQQALNWTAADTAKATEAVSQLEEAGTEAVGAVKTLESIVVEHLSGISQVIENLKRVSGTLLH